VLTSEDRDRIQNKARAAVEGATSRIDPWWVGPGVMAAFLVVMLGYSTWAGLQTSGYFSDPYLSPLYSPCLAINCEHPTFRLIGGWWVLSPALIVMWLPISFRITCYYYRKAYYRAFFFSPPACAVKEPMPRYRGETKFPFILQNLHRYTWYLMMGNMVFLSWDTLIAFRFPDGWGVGSGSLLFLAMIVSMWLYMLSCHSCRHILGGHTNQFSKAPLRYRAWRVVSTLNGRHGHYALISLFLIPAADVYVRLVAAGVIGDIRFL
jgi:hypothetical protein